MPPSERPEPSADPNRVRHAEAALRRLGFARVDAAGASAVRPEFWVQEAGVPRRRFPVYLDAVAPAPAARAGPPVSPTRRAIVVVDNDQAAADAWDRARHGPGGPFESELAILVVPRRTDSSDEPHFHVGTLERPDLLRLATGVVVGLFRAAESGEGQVDFGEMLRLMRRQFSVDVHASLGVSEDEEALFLLYQMAQKYTWAPGDGGASLHGLVLKPSGPAARLPWFAA